jgi:hypothetical protein
MPLIIFLSFIVYFCAQVVECHPRTSQVLVQMMHMFRGDMLQLDPLRLMCLLSYEDVVSKVH